MIAQKSANNILTKSRFISQSGMTLVETLVALSILSVISLGTASLIVAQNREIKFLTQRAEAQELKALIMTVLEKKSNCDWQLKNKVIDVSTTTTTLKSPTEVNLDTLYMGESASSGVIAKTGEKLPSSNQGIVASQVKLNNIYATGNSNEYIGTIEVALEPASLVRGIRPVSVKQIFTIEFGDPLSSARINSCGTKGVQIVSTPTVLASSTSESDQNSCHTLAKAGVVTVSGPMTVQLTVDGKLVGTSIANSGKELGTFNTASVTGLAPAGSVVCGTAKREGTFFPYKTRGFLMTVSYIN